MASTINYRCFLMKYSVYLDVNFVLEQITDQDILSKIDIQSFTKGD